jgi:hypothetical protein
LPDLALAIFRYFGLRARQLTIAKLKTSLQVHNLSANRKTDEHPYHTADNYGRHGQNRPSINNGAPVAFQGIENQVDVHGNWWLPSMPKTDASLQSLLPQRAFSPFHLLRNLGNRGPCFRMPAQLYQLRL